MKNSASLPAFVLLLASVLIAPAAAQPPAAAADTARFRVMFYNVENLFDTVDDTLVDDAEFLPGSEKGWDQGKYYEKLNNIYRVIISCGGWELPALVGLCEVENRRVLEDLVGQTPLKRFGYRIIHFDSPDERGIDVALIYRGDRFEPDTAYPVPVRFPDDPGQKTRDILYACGRIAGEPVHLFVNHWPSRYGGYEATRPLRRQAARVLRTAVDSLFSADPEAAIVAMGDFNDGPADESMLQYLGAALSPEGQGPAGLVNLTARLDRIPGTGTLKYRENWDVFDQLVVSTALLDGPGRLRVTEEGARIHDPDFLLADYPAYPGKKPFRTWAGPRYLGGYSDHLPVFLDLRLR